MQMLTNRTVAELVTERPARARVFEKHGIDYCCGGQRPLAEACAGRGVSLDQVVGELETVDTGQAADQQDWNAARLAELSEHIVGTHHVYLRSELPRLAQMLDKVHSVHGERHAELGECQSVFQGLRAELEIHMMKEERILFPLIAALELGDAAAASHCGSVNNPIHQMEHEHDAAGAALERLRTLTNSYTPPADACNTYRAMLDGLAELESDLHLHIHKENNILFPRAAKLEAAMAQEPRTPR